MASCISKDLFRKSNDQMSSAGNKSNFPADFAVLCGEEQALIMQTSSDDDDNDGQEPLDSQTSDIWKYFTDAHCHPIDTPSNIHLLPKLRTSQFFVMGTRPDDWDAVQDVARQWPAKVVPAFGIHPWFVQHQPSDICSTPVWSRLRACLEAHPTAMVGEIGIDGVASDRLTKEKYPLPHQVDIFKRQLDLAAKLRRTVNVHTVQCHGKLLEIVREYDSKLPSGKDRRKAKANSRHSSSATNAAAASEQLQPDPFPPKFINHSYSGSADIILQLIRLPRIGRRFYFSFSSAINSRSPKTLSRIRCVPDNRILIESDLHDPAGMDEQMWKSCELVAEAKGWSMMECAQKIAKNVHELLNHDSTQH